MAVPATLRPRRAVPASGPDAAQAIRTREAIRAPQPWRALVAACLAISALTLLLPRAPTYDPWAWLIWGRQISEGSLDTVAGPSWKPLPVLFTTVFSALGDDVAPALWLIVAGAGGLLAAALAFRLARRFAGPPAGVLAVAALVLAAGFVANPAHGNSEGLLVGLSLWAFERHLDGRHRHAFLLGAAAGLLRPEIWPFLAAYGLWLVARDWQQAPPWRTLALVGGSGAATALLWFVPEYVGSGDFLRAANRALEPVPGSPAQAEIPFLAVFTNSAPAVSVPVYVGATAAVAIGVGRWWRRPDRIPGVLVVAAIAAMYMVTVAVLAQIGFTGNLRYVTLPVALVCLLAGVGWTWLVAGTRARHGRRVAAALTVVSLAAATPFLLASADSLRDSLESISVEAHRAYDADTIVARAGGPDAVLGCGQVYTSPLETQLLAWHLGVPSREVGIHPRPPGTVVAPVGSAEAADPRFGRMATSGRWVARSTCRPGSPRP